MNAFASNSKATGGFVDVSHLLMIIQYVLNAEKALLQYEVNSKFL